jgi:hypothetical protein
MHYLNKGKAQEVENQEGQGPLWAVVPLMMMKKECNMGSSCPYINAYKSNFQNTQCIFI